MPKTTIDQREQNVNEQYNAGRDVHINARPEDNPYRDMEEYQGAGGMARGLMIVGGILMTVGFLAFFGGIVVAIMGGAQAAMSQGMPSSSSFSGFAIAPIGFGIIVVGMILYVIGRQMARSAAYKNQMKRQ
jgi:hypothetical protein